MEIEHCTCAIAAARGFNDGLQARQFGSFRCIDALGEKLGLFNNCSTDGSKTIQ